MKESLKVKTAVPTVRDFSRAVLLQIGSAACGFFGARGALAGALMPFGLSAAAGMPVLFAPAAAFGALAGYFVPAVSGGVFRYLAALFALLSVRLMLWNRRRLVEHPLFSAALCLATAMLTAGVGNVGISSDFLPLCCEALLSAGGAFCFARAGAAIRKRPIALGLNEVSVLAICLAVLQIGACNVVFYGIGIGRVIGVLLILIAARYGGIRSGAVIGIAIGFADLLAGVSPALCCAYAFGGMVAGLCTVFGKYAQILAFFGVVVVGMLSVGTLGETVYYALDIFFAALIFQLLPRRFFAFCNAYLCVQPKISSATGTRQDVRTRLMAAAGALNEVAQTVNRVSSELGQPARPDYSRMLDDTRREVCAGCKLRPHCWESRKDDTLAALFAMTKAVRCGNNIPEQAAPAEFRARCVQLRLLGQAVWRNFSDYATKAATESNLQEVERVIGDQFEGLAGLLNDLQADLAGARTLDHPAAVNFASGLTDLGLQASECSCSTDRYGRIRLRFFLGKSGDFILNRMQIKRLAEQVCDREFEVPTVHENGHRILVQLVERAVMAVEFGQCRLAADRNRLCGDCARAFLDGNGHFYIVLSDGMGTGGRAAVDSTMAAGVTAQLLTAGFSPAYTLKMLNAAMLFKSGDESSATVDIAAIDLFTGDTVLHKAGAAPTVVRRGETVGIAESHSLPVGILREICFDKACVRLHIGDVLLMLSDGATTDGTDWIKAELTAFSDGSAEDFARRIATIAQQRCSTNADDVTVLCALIKRNY